MVDSYQFGRSVRPYDIPIIGEDIARTNHIIDLWSDPCSPSAEVWALALWHSLPTFIISVTKPEIIDISIEHDGRGRRKGRKLKLFGDILLRDNLVTIPLPRWTVFRLFEWTQRLGWYFLIADATADLSINWMSMAYQWTGCDGTQDPPRMNAFVDPTSSYITGGEGWVSPNMSFDEQHHIQVTANPRFRITKPCIPYFSFRGGFQPFPDGLNGRIVKWRLRSTLEVSAPLEHYVDPSQGMNPSINFNEPPYREYPAGTEFWFELYKTAGAIGVSSRLQWHMTSAEFPYKANIGPDP